ncbi:MAG: 3-deoxy-8-phosphooctulonate synthase [Acidobacteria bacterium]|nr:3-deoxy-8-phosphooctulonate synthase [Acidobacteriota bacterium]
MIQSFQVGNVRVGGTEAAPFFIAGPCVIESEAHALRMARLLTEIFGRVGIPFIFKASYDKANRSSIRSFRGPGLVEGTRILKTVRDTFGVPILTDVHAVHEVETAAEAADVLQVPAFLCRQTDLVVEAGRSGRVVNVKKGQFLAPWDMGNVVEKIRSTGNDRIILTERGHTLGYNNLVVDFRAFAILRETGCPVVFDATHAVQIPGGLGDASGGDARFIEPLARGAAAFGVDGLFFEVHDDPARALCDGPNALHSDRFEALVRRILAVAKATNGEEGIQNSEFRIQNGEG